MKISLSLAAVSLGLYLAACSTQAPPPSKTGTVSGARLYESQQCLLCHGPDGNGLPGMGPDLRGASANWTSESLMEYLKNPKTYAEKDERLAANMGKFRMPMPNCNLKEDQLRTLAEHVLAIE